MDVQRRDDMVGVPLVYIRQGYSNCVLTLREDGAIVDGPGHAEARWRWDKTNLIFQDDVGAETGLLEPRFGAYIGRILDRIEVALRIFRWPIGYQFGGAVGERLEEIRRSPPMRYILGIPFVNRPDLLERAIASVPSMRHRLVVVDNSNFRELRGRKPLSDEIVYEPPVPLTFVQTMNLLQQMAHEAECDVVCFMHNDAEAEAGMDQRFLDRIQESWKNDPSFGVLFTHYDTLAAMNMETVRKIGPWDGLFSGYFADNEYYGRLRKYGYSEIKTDVAVNHHGSMTVRTDPRLSAANSILFPSYKRMFHELCG